MRREDQFRNNRFVDAAQNSETSWNLLISVTGQRR